MTENSDSVRELRMILKVLILSNATVIEKELAKIATTNERKKMWVAINGKLMPKDIASQTDVTQMAVSNFLGACKTAGFIEYTKGEPPKRILDYVPPSWIDLAKLPIEAEEKAENQPDATVFGQSGDKR